VCRWCSSSCSAQKWHWVFSIIPEVTTIFLSCLIALKFNSLNAAFTIYDWQVCRVNNLSTIEYATLSMSQQFANSATIFLCVEWISPLWLLHYQLPYTGAVLTTWVYEPHPLCQVVGMSLFSGHHGASLGWLLQLKINSTQLALKNNLDRRHCRLDYHEFMELYTYVAPLECTWLKLENHNWIYFSSDKEHDKGLVQIMVTG